MLRHIKILLIADYRAWLNSFKHDRQAWRKGVFKCIGYLFFIVALSVLGWSLFSFLRTTDAPSQTTLGVINGFMMFGIIMVVKELMESSLKNLYEAPDMQLLHAAPIRSVSIFGYKFVQITNARILSMLCFIGPPWVVFGVIYELPWHFYVVLIPLSVCLLVIITSYVTISMLVITRFFSSAALLTTLKILGTIIGISVGFLLSLSLFSGSGSLPVRRVFLDWVSARTADTTTAWFLHEWIGKMLFSWGTESTIWERLKWGIGGFTVGTVSIGFALLTAQLIYQRGWENIRQIKSKRKSTRNNINATTSDLNGIFVTFGRGKIQSMMLKDFLIYIRHTGRAIAIIMLTLFLLIHIGILVTDGSDMDENSVVILSVQLLLYSIIITFGISCNGLRDEAKTWWMMKSAPVSAKLIFTSKFLTAIICAFFYAEFWALIAVYLLRIPVANWALILLTPIIILPVVCALNTTIGTLPWMAELTDNPKPFFRVLTFTITLILDLAFVIMPIIAMHSQSLLFLLMMSILFIGVFVISYRYGISNLHKYLVAQVT
ncbi:MAG: hypothetical protein OXD54_16005 [Candidatus Poribacteria bacterium]|nr:hypothetical protein [Candidatus Poribacteria bacterium]